MASVVITESEICEALAALVAERGKGSQDARTVAEMAAASGRSLPSVRRALTQLKKEGRLLVHWVPRELLDGRVRAISAYTILPKGKNRA